MPTLYKILQRHAGPKSSVEFVQLFVLADSEQAILARLDRGGGDFTYGAWQERNVFDEDVHDEDERGPDGARLLPLYDADYNEIGTETYLEKMLRLRGEIDDEDANFDNAYYGIRHYGWSEAIEVTDEQFQFLLTLGIAEDWRGEVPS